MYKENEASLEGVGSLLSIVMTMCTYKSITLAKYVIVG